MNIFSTVVLLAAAPCFAHASQPNIVELAASVKDLSTLVTAVKAASLVDTLEGPGPFTVFAPTNEAFAALPKETLDNLLKPENIKELQAVLEYHVLSGSVHSKDLKPFQKVKTVEGEEIEIKHTHLGHVYVNNARVIDADVDASNGVVHVIDHVLLPHIAPTPKPTPSPPQAKNIVELAAGNKDLSTLVTALKAANLTGALSSKGPFTVFAPSNEAFEKIPKYFLDKLLEPRNVGELTKILEYHVIAGASIHSTDLKPFQDVKTLEGDEVKIESEHNIVVINNARVTTANVDASNGVVHIIDHVLFPYSKMLRKHF